MTYKSITKVKVISSKFFLEVISTKLAAQVNY